MIDPDFILSLLADVENTTGKLSDSARKNLFKKFHVTVKTHTSFPPENTRLVSLLSESTLKAIAKNLHHKNACLHDLFPVSFCGAFENEDTCINCYIQSLKHLK